MGKNNLDIKNYKLYKQAYINAQIETWENEERKKVIFIEPKNIIPSVYVIKCQNYFKIGIANNVNDRFSSIKTGNPFPLTIELSLKHIKAKKIEKNLHKIFSKKRHRNEWFNLEDKDINFIKIYIEKYEN